MTRIRTTLAMCGLAAALLVSCSSGDDKAATPTTAAGPAISGRAVDSGFTGQDSAEFCALAKTYNDRAGAVAPGSTPDQLRTGAQDSLTAINEALAAAPAEIKPDVQVVANTFGAMIAELEKVGFDTTKAPATAFAPLQAPEFQASTTRFQAYLTQVCGITR